MSGSGSHQKQSTALPVNTACGIPSSPGQTTTFNIDARYTPIKVIGSGAYGVVCSARDTKSSKLVAIKKISKAFEIVTISKRTLLEIKLLRHFHRHDNIIAIESILQPPPAPSPFNDVYIVMELLESDLHKIIYSKQELTEEHVRYFLYQMLRGLKFIHSANVLHRDIKPGNLLLTSTCDLKICDFGMARGIATSPAEHAGFMTAYVATRWYRAPEVMLSFRQYTFAIDVWSVACIFAEMLARKHLFPGTNYVDQLNLVLKYLGIPNEDCINRIGSQKAQTYLRALKPITPPPLEQVFPSASLVYQRNALDLLSKMLKFDPEERISVQDALAHPFLRQYHDPDDEPTCRPFEFDFEGNNAMDASELRTRIVEEIRLYDAPSRKNSISRSRRSSAQPSTPTSASTASSALPTSPSPAMQPLGSGGSGITQAFHGNLFGGSAIHSQAYTGASSSEPSGKRRRSDSNTEASTIVTNKAAAVSFNPYVGVEGMQQAISGTAVQNTSALALDSPLGALDPSTGFGSLTTVPERSSGAEIAGIALGLMNSANGSAQAGLEGSAGEALDERWLEGIDPSWMDPTSDFNAELEMGDPSIFHNLP